nr:hypothetical protein [uncultured Flavobacterium sp.]
MKSKNDDVIFLRRKLNNLQGDEFSIKGSILSLVDDDINSIQSLLKNNLIEISESGTNKGIYEDSIQTYLGDTVIVEIRTADVDNYFETTRDFINGNKFEYFDEDFYIGELDYKKNESNHAFFDKYKNNILLIDFLKEIAHSYNETGSNLEFVFYKYGKAINLIVDYDFEELMDFNFSISQEIKDKLKGSVCEKEKKQIFLNELINFLDKEGNTYIVLTTGWDNLVSNYDKSYSLFLEGFSFEQIKTSSTEYFQKLVDRIYESIGKASNYIFGIPIGYILLLNNFDFSGQLWVKNFALLILGFVFSMLIWFILIKNIEESIDAIESDIANFLTKIKDVTQLDAIYVQLLGLKTILLKKQRNKLLLVSILTIFILLTVILTFLFIFFDKSIFMI